MSRGYSAEAQTRGSVRLRVYGAHRFDLVLVVPRHDFYGQIKSRGPSRLEIATVRGSQWSQLEIVRTSARGAAPEAWSEVLTMPLVGRETIEITRVTTLGPRERNRTVTVITARGRFDWQSSRAATGRPDTGRAMDGSGSGVNPLGEPYTYTTAGNRTTTVTKMNDGNTRTAVTTVSPWGTRVDVQTTDPSGGLVDSGSGVSDDTTGTWSKTVTTNDGSGGTITSTSSGTSDSRTSSSTHVDANGNLIDSRHSAKGAGEDGTSSEVTSDVDAIDGTVTITSTSTDSDGTVYTHVTVSDASGNTIRDESTVTPPPGSASPSSGQSGDGGGEGGGNGSGDGSGNGGGDAGGDAQGDGGGGGDGDGDGSGDQGADAQGQGDGEGSGGAAGSGSGSGSDDAPDDDGTPGLPGSRGGSDGTDVGPSFPRGVLGSIFDELHVIAGGGGDDDERPGLPRLVGDRLKSAIESAYSEPAQDRSGGLVIDIVMPAPPGAVDDWGDRPNPREMTALVAMLNDCGAALGGLPARMRQAGASP